MLHRVDFYAFVDNALKNNAATGRYEFNSSNINRMILENLFQVQLWQICKSASYIFQVAALCIMTMIQSLYTFSKHIESNNHRHYCYFYGYLSNFCVYSCRQNFYLSIYAFLAAILCSVNGCRSFVSFNETKERRRYCTMLLLFVIMLLHEIRCSMVRNIYLAGCSRQLRPCSEYRECHSENHR